MVGIIGSALATAYRNSILYEVTRFDTASYMSAAALLLVTALAGAYVPARRSSRVDPMVALKDS